MNEQREQELREQVEAGQRAKAAREFVEEFVLRQRAVVVYKLEREGSEMPEERLRKHVLYMALLRNFEQTMKTYIDKGEIAEEEILNGIN